MEMKEKSILVSLAAINEIFWIFLSIAGDLYYAPLLLSTIVFIYACLYDYDYHIFIGALLLFYASLLTPAYFDPSDLIVSTGWLAISASLNIPMPIIIIWALSGYVALIFAIYLFGKSIYNWKFYSNSFKNLKPY
jgi:hypothetical protein